MAKEKNQRSLSKNLKGMDVRPNRYLKLNKKRGRILFLIRIIKKKISRVGSPERSKKLLRSTQAFLGSIQFFTYMTQTLRLRRLRLIKFLLLFQNLNPKKEKIYC